MNKLFHSTLSALESVSVRPGSTEQVVQEYDDVSTGLGKPKMAKKQTVSPALPESRFAGAGSVDQSGMVSLVICMLLMIVISLMTLSFATLSRREQRQALDKQLSTQAFYAAETGINDVAKALLDGTLPPNTNISDCSAEQQNLIKLGPDIIPSTLDANSSTSRTCVLVDQTPTQIEDVVGETESSVFLISAAGLSSLDIYWENDSAVSTPAFVSPFDTTTGVFPPDASWNPNTPGVLTIQLIPFPVAGLKTRAGIASGTIYTFGFPTSSNTNQTATGTGANGLIMGGGCATSNTPRHCRVTINGLSGEYYIRLKSTYDPVHVTIEGKNGSTRLPFVGAQVLIDSTGRANDVTKRIKVYKPLRASASLPGSVLEIGDDLCKRLQSNPASTTTDSSIASCQPVYP